MAEIRHLENRHNVIFSTKGGPIWIKFRTGAEWHFDCGDVVEIETRCRIPIWQTFGRIQWHVIPEPPATLQGAATCKFNVMIPELHVTLQGAATGRMQWHVIPEPRITLQGAATWWIHCHDSRATLQGAVTWRNKCRDCATLQALQGVRIPSATLKIVFLPYLTFCF